MTTKIDIALSAPPIAVTGGAAFLGYTLPEWAAIATIAYTLLLTVRLVRKEWQEWKRNKDSP